MASLPLLKPALTLSPQQKLPPSPPVPVSRSLGKYVPGSPQADSAPPATERAPEPQAIDSDTEPKRDHEGPLFKLPAPVSSKDDDRRWDECYPTHLRSCSGEDPPGETIERLRNSSRFWESQCLSIFKKYDDLLGKVRHLEAELQATKSVSPPRKSRDFVRLTGLISPQPHSAKHWWL